MPNILRALQILAEREVAPQLGLLKSTLLQLDATFSERDFGAGSFLEFIQKLRKAGLVEMRRTDRGYLVEVTEGEPAARETQIEPAAEIPAAVEADPTAAGEAPSSEVSSDVSAAPADAVTVSAPAPVPPSSSAPSSMEESLAALRQALPLHFEKAPNRPLYLRQIRQLLRAAGSSIDERSGFRGLLDLLHQAQREGWLRLHRDRKGVWRAFPAGSLTSAASTSTPADVAVGTEAPLELGQELEPGIEQELEHEFLMPVETDVNWESMELPEEHLEPDTPPVVIEVIEEVVAAPAELAPQPKPRKGRTPKSGAKTTAKRKAPAKRKAKETEAPKED
jgi:hypothetical protein